MRTRSKLILAGLAATLLMSLAVSAASASRLSISNKNFRVTWTELIFTGPAGEGFVTCPATMEGSFHSATIRKVEGALIGHISRASVASASCRGGSATFNQASLPWHVTYLGFIGSLPKIELIILLLQGVNFTVEVSGIRCGYGRPEDNARGNANVEAGGAITSFRPDPSIRLNRLSGGFSCPEQGGLAGPGMVTLLGNTTKITIRLI
jgi:hypothetical protein